MRVLTIVHQEDSAAGVFVDPLSDQAEMVDVWVPDRQPEAPAPPADYDAIITFGGSAHPHQVDRHPWLVVEKRYLKDAIDQHVPMFGVCLGSQLIAEAAGSTSRRASHPEIGWFQARLTDAAVADPLVGHLPDTLEVLHWHSYEVPLPPGAVALATSDICLQAYRLGDRVWGVQFHPEVSARDFQRWLDVYDHDPDAVAIGLDPVALGRETHDKIAAWNHLGRDLCARFLTLAAGLSPRAGALTPPS